MKHFDRLLAVSLLTAVLIGAPAEEAQAYLDPGTGSLIVQGIVAAVTGALIAIKVWWKQIATFFGAKPARDETEEPPSRPS
jgi:hypothetical protein